MAFKVSVVRWGRGWGGGVGVSSLVLVNKKKSVVVKPPVHGDEAE